MKEVISQKREKFGKEIRRHKINNYMAQCRSKLTQNWIQNIAEDYAKLILDRIFPKQMSKLDKMRCLLEIMIGKTTVQIQEEEHWQYNKQNVSNLIMLRKEQTLICQSWNSQNVELTEKDITWCLTYFSQLLCQRNKQIHQKLREVNKILNAGNKAAINILQNHLLSILEYISYINSILGYFNIMLQFCSKNLLSMESDKINTNILESITTCLIELSFFRPRTYVNAQNCFNIDKINHLMKQYRDTLNVVTSQHLLTITKQMAFKFTNAKLSTNVIYIFGNIYISLSSHEAQGKFLLKDIHELVFAVFQHIFTLISSEEEDSQQNIIKVDVKKQFPEISSLMIWFIRNTILMVQNFNHFGQNTQSITDPLWYQICVKILKQIWMDTNKREKILEKEIENVCLIMSTIKLLKNDFNLSIQEYFSSFKQLYYLTELLQQDQKNFNTLMEEIYSCIFELISCEYLGDQELDLRPLIKKIISNIINQGQISSIGMSICYKVIDSGVFDNEYKENLSEILYNNFGILLKKVEQMNENALTISFLKLVQALILMSEVPNSKTTMELEWIGFDSLKDLIQLCSKIWENQKSTDEIIYTLLFIKIVANTQTFEDPLKQILINEGYRNELQNLSSNPNQEINQLVYDIYQTLQLDE